MSAPYEKMVADAAVHAAETHPVALPVAITKLDRHLVDQELGLWLAWCSVRVEVLRGCTTRSDA